MVGLQSLSRMARRMSPPLRVKPVRLPTSNSSIPQHELVDEELWSIYDYKRYYPAKPGEILDGHYQLLVKVSWGKHSTVKLARDVTRHVLSSCYTSRGVQG